MKQTKLSLAGATKANPQINTLHSFFPDVQISSFDVRVTRGGEAHQHKLTVENNDMVLVEFEGNIQWFYDQNQFDSKLKQQQQQGRSIENKDGEYTLPSEWHDETGTRGILGDALKLIGINVFKNVSGKPVAKAIAAHIEKNNGDILYTCNDNFQFIGPFESIKADPKPYLLFLHGTASSTAGSFGGLQTENKGNAYQTLFKQYEKRVLAYEHRTLTESPVKNILELLKQFPAEITLDVITHSRGGLLGEVLARVADPNIDGAFTKTELDALKQNEEAKDLVKEIVELNRVAKKKKVTIAHYVRVACPAAGTTLISKRVDTFLNVMFNGMSFIGGEVLGTFVDGLQALVMAVVKEKNNFGTLPGLECMNPVSPFIRVLNYVETSINTPLTVIAGDAVGEGFFKKLSMFLVDFFYQEDNDLVVNTSSMKKGTRRKSYFQIYDEQRADVNHFNYFINSSSQKIILDSLKDQHATSRGFYSSELLIEKSTESLSPATRSLGSPKDKPVLFVLPGIMGSHLTQKKERIWLNYFRLATGQLSKIKADQEVQPEGINGDAYKELVDYFSNSYYVVPFAYDWRHTVFNAADELKIQLDNIIKAGAKNVFFIVHSMGGLVIRAFIIKYPALWKTIQDKGNCRIVMLGTPNEGSYDVPYLLTGHGKTIRNVAMLDLAHSMKSLLQQFIEYPGLLQLLPVKVADDFRDLTLWNKMNQVSEDLCPIPLDANLKAFKEMHEKFAQFKWDPNIIKYVAGKGDETPHKMVIDKENGDINFYSTPYGDGTVTWDSIPIELKSKSAVYYVNASHGNMANHEAAFPFYKELLEKGHTKELTQVPALLRGEAPSTLMRDIEVVIMPSEAELSKNILQIKSKKKKIKTQQVKVSIIHGDMGHAKYPVLVGHFEGDAIVNAEQVLNKKLNNYFAERFDTNNYPGAIGTHEIVLAPSTKPSGGIVIGLGSFGSLNENNLSQSIKQALLTYILKSKESQAADFTSKSGKGLGVSCLLIGSGYGALTIYSSMKAILKAVMEANDFFKNKTQHDYSLIDELEIIELYQYKAVQASRMLNHILSEGDRFDNMIFSPSTIKRVSGRKNEIPNEMQNDWWHRLKVCEDEKETQKGRTRIIKFSSLTDKARNEEELLATNISIIDELVKKAAAVNNMNPKLCQTLYELLVPNTFKSYGSDLRNVVMILDKETARYPWEMMQDAHGVNKDPFVTRAGFVRQLSTTTYRLNAKMADSRTALVIGNPELHNIYPDLPGAAIEAQSVADLLSPIYDTLTLIQSEGFDIIEKLYSSQYKIVHIAAHGIVNEPKTGQTGVVLGENLILTPSDFKQMRFIPELVFINCCSLGTIKKEDEELLQRKYEVAAGIGTQLIEMGVRAVIVAGWEVDDLAAKCFSETFYREVLKGQDYGRAILIARENTFRLFPTKNTWGAYQCYGDPFYKLRDINNASSSYKFTFYDPIEAEHALENLLNKLEVNTQNTSLEKNIKELEAIIEAIQKYPDWMFEASIIEKIANIYLEANQKELAVKYYKQLFNLENATYSVRSIEQYANINIKVAVKEFNAMLKPAAEINKDKIAEQRETTIQTITEMIGILNNLNANATSERYCMLGSAYKRMAEVSLNQDVVVCLLDSANAYFEAHKLYLKNRNRTYYYPFYNFLITKSLIEGLLNAKQKNSYKDMLAVIDNEEELIEDGIQHALETDAIKPNFWNKTAKSLALFYTILITPDKKGLNTISDQIVEDHKNAWTVEGSANKVIAIDEHVQFVLDFLSHHKIKISKHIEFLDLKIDILQNLKKRLDE